MQLLSKQTHDDRLARLADIGMASRTVICGDSGCGKSTLADKLLIPAFLQNYLNSSVLLADTKPRYRAEYELNGLKAGRRYKKWGYGQTLKGSVVLPLSSLESVKAELKQALNFGARVIVAQTEEEERWPLISEAIRSYYADYDAKRPRLVYVDEALDFWGENGRGLNGRPIARIARSGRERNIGLLVGSQRPKGFPKALLTNMVRLFLFRLGYTDDFDHLTEMSVPPTFRAPDVDRQFTVFDKQDKSLNTGVVYHLDL